MNSVDTEACLNIERLVRMAIHSAMVRLTDRWYGPTTLEEQTEVATHDVMEIVRMLVTKK